MFIAMQTQSEEVMARNASMAESRAARLIRNFVDLIIYGDSDIGRLPWTACTKLGVRVLNDYKADSDNAPTPETDPFWMAKLTARKFSWYKLLNKEERLFKEGKVKEHFEGTHTKRKFRRQIGARKGHRSKEERTAFWQNAAGETGNRRRAAIAAERERTGY